LQHTDSLHPFNGALRGRKGQFQLTGNSGGCDEWICRQEVNHSQRRIRRLAGQLASPLDKQIIDARRPAQRILGHTPDSL